MGVAQPPFIKSVEEFNKKADEYIALTKENKEPLTITGLVYHLGFESRQSFYDYRKNKAYSYSIKRFTLLIENAYEKNLHNNQKTTGAIFALKNMGWTDKQEIAHEGITPTIVFKDFKNEP